MTEDERRQLPPGQHAIEHMPALHVGSIPEFDPATWDLRVDGEVREPRTFSYDEVRSLPLVVDMSSFHCVEGWSLVDIAWEGVRFSDMAELVSPTERARFVNVGCDGQYTTSLAMEDMMQPGVLLAWGMNGRELEPEHGFPLRLVVSHKYSYKSAKWVRRIRFSCEGEIGYWEQRGYSNSADPWKEERRS